ncbi:hypothetical protein MN608_06935 [Microdochium nivale]|nr:hypothetical protein MN608_06935 [Microdochium nivale]
MPLYNNARPDCNNENRCIRVRPDVARMEKRLRVRQPGRGSGSRHGARSIVDTLVSSMHAKPDSASFPIRRPDTSLSAMLAYTGRSAAPVDPHMHSTRMVFSTPEAGG